jgi:hypothetical protein
VFRVPGHHVQTVPTRGCGNEAIADRYNLVGLLRFGRKFAPDVIGFGINRQDAVGVMGFERLHPDP